MKTYKNLFEQIISTGNLFIAWERFKKGKRNKRDVAKFEFDLERNIFKLHRDLKEKKYKHGPYFGFYIRDPKVRHIHKATVRDRIVHHAVFRVLNFLFEPMFISTCFSCRIGKGNHKGVLVVEKILRKASQNYTQPCYVLKCDIKKFFDSVDHTTLIKIIECRIKDENVRWLIREIIRSYSSAFTREREREREYNRTSEYSFIIVGSNRGVDQDPNGVYGRGTILNGKETFKRLFIKRV